PATFIRAINFRLSVNAQGCFICVIEPLNSVIQLTSFQENLPAAGSYFCNARSVSVAYINVMGFLEKSLCTDEITVLIINDSDRAQCHAYTDLTGKPPKCIQVPADAQGHSGATQGLIQFPLQAIKCTEIRENFRVASIVATLL